MFRCVSSQCRMHDFCFHHMVPLTLLAAFTKGAYGQLQRMRRNFYWEWVDFRLVHRVWLMLQVCLSSIFIRSHIEHWGRDQALCTAFNDSRGNIRQNIYCPGTYNAYRNSVWGCTSHYISLWPCVWVLQIQHLQGYIWRTTEMIQNLSHHHSLQLKTRTLTNTNMTFKTTKGGLSFTQYFSLKICEMWMSIYGYLWSFIA